MILVVNCLHSLSCDMSIASLTAGYTDSTINNYSFKFLFLSLRLSSRSLHLLPNTFFPYMFSAIALFKQTVLNKNVRIQLTFFFSLCFLFCSRQDVPFFFDSV